MTKLAKLITLAVACLTLTGYSQSTNSQTWTDTVKSVLTSSNITFVGYATKFENVNAYGGGFMLLYDFNNYVSAGLGSDWAGEWRQFSGTVSLHYTLNITPKLTATGYGIVAAGSSTGGAGNDNGAFATGEGGGVHFNYHFNDRWSAGLGLGAITRQNCGDYSGLSEILTGSVGYSF